MCKTGGGEWNRTTDLRVMRVSLNLARPVAQNPPTKFGTTEWLEIIVLHHTTNLPLCNILFKKCAQKTHAALNHEVNATSHASGLSGGISPNVEKLCVWSGIVLSKLTEWGFVGSVSSGFRQSSNFSSVSPPATPGLGSFVLAKAGSGSAPVTVNLYNQGSPSTVTTVTKTTATGGGSGGAGGLQAELEKQVVSIFMKDANSNGPMWQAITSVVGAGA